MNDCRVYPEMIPSHLVEVCPMGSSLSQKEKDGTITEDEKKMLKILNVFECIEEPIERI